jgi:hypothetical protein
MIDHTVRAVVRHVGDTFEIARTFKEQWVKKTGTATQTFSGHTTEYFIDGVQKPEKEYQAFVDRLIPPQILKLLVIPGYFNDILKAEERRSMLIGMCGDVDEADMLADKKWDELRPHITKLTTVADLKKSKAAQKTKINEELRLIPAKIDTHTTYLNAGGFDLDAERAAVEGLRASISDLERARAGLRNGETVAQLRRELIDLEAEFAKAKQAAAEADDARRLEVRNRLNKAQAEVDHLDADYRATLRISNELFHELEVNGLKSKREKLLAEYRSLEHQEFTEDCTCPFCKQALPEDKVQSMREAFNEKKAKELDRIIEDGTRIAAEIETKAAEQAAAKETLQAIEAELEAAKNALAAIKSELDNITPSAPVFDTKRIETKKVDIAAAQESSAPLENEYSEKLSGLELAKAAREKNIAAAETAQRAQKDIDDLKAREKILAAQFEECEKLISLCDDFTSAKVKMLDAKISGAFKQVQFKLTETLVNGAMREICDTMIPVDGALVPYSAANNAARVQANCDIVATFQAHYGIEMPVFIDNRESVVRLPAMPCQVISLVVSEADKQLRIEVA